METAVPNPDERTDRQKRFELQQLAEIAAFKGYLEELRKRKVPSTSSRPPDALSRTPYVLKPKHPDADKMTYCYTCHKWVLPGQHGSVREDHEPGHPNFGKDLPCPTCTGREGYEDARRRRVFQRLMEESALPHMARQWDFTSFGALVQADEAKAEAYADARNYAMGILLKLTPPYRNLYLFGPYGGGKTGLAISVLKYRLANGQPGLYSTLPDLLDRIRRTYDRRPGDEGETADRIVRQLQDIDLLVLDDIGAERPTEWVLEKLFQILDARMRNEKETVYTSNIPMDGLAARLGERIVERIEYLTWLSEVGGRNLRTTPALEQIKARRNGRAPEPSRR